MATSKTVKKTATKKAPARPVAKTKVKHVAKAKKPVMRSFAPAPASEPFMTFRLTNQTLYWAILAAFVLALGIWVTVISVRVQHIYDTIDATNAQADALVIPMEKS